MTAVAAGLPLPVWAKFNPAEAALGGRPRTFDPHQHYPSEVGIQDVESGCRFFFHHHRPEEYGHFHTFGRDEYGAPIHIVMITINAAGMATKLTTTNQWVTGTRYVDAAGMSTFIDRFSLKPANTKQPQLSAFIHETVTKHRTAIGRLYRERDAWLAEQKRQGNPSPFTDKRHEELSSFSLVST